MPLTTFVANSTARASEVNGNFALCVLTDTARTITVTHTWSASQTFSAGWSSGGPCILGNVAAIVPAGVTSAHAGNYITSGPSSLSASDRGVIYVQAYGSLTAPIIGVKAAGTYSSPSAVTVASGSILTFQADSYDGTAWATGGSMSFGPTETWAVGSHGTEFVVGTAARGGTAIVSRLFVDEVGMSLMQSGSTGGNIGIGTTAIVGQGIRMVGTQTTRADQYGGLFSPTFNASATTSGMVLYVNGNTAASSFTMPAAYGLYVEDWGKGAGSTITKQYGVFIAGQTKGGTNFAMGFGSGNTQTTIGANGAASALTAAPLGYLKVEVNGTSAVIPYYNA